MQADDGGTVELIADTITGGTVALNSAGAATQLQIEGTVTLALGTTVTLTDSSQNAIVSTPTKSRATPRWSITAPSAAPAASAATFNLTLDNYGNIAASRQPLPTS